MLKDLFITSHFVQASTPQFVDPKSRIGHAKVKRAPNSDCMLHDPAETLVVRPLLLANLEIKLFPI
jgi:hypothetical protein